MYLIFLADDSTRVMIRIGPFKFAPVQPEPLPDFVVFLQQAHLDGLEFYRVPINETTDANYLVQYIAPLINEHLKGRARDAILDYNKNPADPEKRKIALAVFTTLELSINVDSSIPPVGETTQCPPVAPQNPLISSVTKR
jgi:hypothetical protein